MSIKEAIILAGGLGTRLRDAVPDLPKCMAPVAGRPFLFYVINQLRSEGIDRFIFSLGYKHEVIESWLADQFATLNYETVIEAEPLGTGGAIQLACSKVKDKHVLIVNGDTLFRVSVPSLAAIHAQQAAHCTLALKPLQQFDRYGVVAVDNTGFITAFEEKKYYDKGLINGGVYLLNVPVFLDEELPGKFSFEKDYLESFYKKRRITGITQEGYFIDIGIPEDFNRAQQDFAFSPLVLSGIDKTWTLFLDRDGVINTDKDGSYIFNAGEFYFEEGATEAIAKCTALFGRIIIVTNQRGVGRGLMTEDALSGIHEKMQTAVEAAGGRIDKIYYCTSTDKTHPNRKPNPGMAYAAKHDFPAIDFSRSLIVGNNPSDMLFGRNAGMFTVFVKTTRPHYPLPHPDIDLAFDSLAAFAKAL